MLADAKIPLKRYCGEKSSLLGTSTRQNPMRNVGDVCTHMRKAYASGCMSALARYEILLARCCSPDEAGTLRSDAANLLQRLQKIDADRKERYVDLGMCRASTLSIAIDRKLRAHENRSRM